jgi:hypothetical protein
MRTTLYATILALSLVHAPAAPAQTSSGAKEDPDQPVQGGGALPSGWTARTDKDGQAANIKFVRMEPGYHLTLGPATILYREKDRATGPFHTLARFDQTKKLRHSEGYGLFMGGQSLAGKEQKYTYFLVRDDGSYLIKRRDGEKTSDISKGWVPHPSVKKADSAGKASNLLEIDAKQDPSKVEFKVNGKTVHAMNASELSTKGIVGLRVNHNLDVHIQDFDLHQ